jgi:hypothetical protein
MAPVQNPIARQFFTDHPHARYFYVNPNIRFPNPDHRDQDQEPAPWPPPESFRIAE